MAKVHDFDSLVQRSQRPRSRVGRGLLSANLPIIVQQIAANTAALKELLAINEKAIVAHRKSEAEAQARAEESAKRAAEREAADRLNRLAEAANAQAEAAIEEAGKADAKAKAAAGKKTAKASSK